MSRSWTSNLGAMGLVYIPPPLPATASSWVNWSVGGCWRGLVSRAAYQRLWLWSCEQVPASAIWRWKAPYWQRGLRVAEMTREQLENEYPVNIMVDTGTGEVIAEEYVGPLA